VVHPFALLIVHASYITATTVFYTVGSFFQPQHLRHQ